MDRLAITSYVTDEPVSFPHSAVYAPAVFNVSWYSGLNPKGPGPILLYSR
jgi:hypothetical protein